MRLEKITQRDEKIELSLTLVQIRELLPILDLAVLHYFEDFELDGSQKNKVQKLMEILSINDRLDPNLLKLIELKESLTNYTSVVDFEIKEVRRSLFEMNDEENSIALVLRNIQNRVDNLIKTQNRNSSKSTSASKGGKTASKAKEVFQKLTASSSTDVIDAKFCDEKKTQRERISRIDMSKNLPYYSDILNELKAKVALDRNLILEIITKSNGFLLETIPLFVFEYFLNHNIKLSNQEDLDSLIVSLSYDVQCDYNTAR
jgi:hypothetical protein